jgi:hypothetical protein
MEQIKVYGPLWLYAELGLLNYAHMAAKKKK